MTTEQDYLVNIQPIEKRLLALQQRHNKIKLLSLGGGTLFLVALITLFFQHEIIYSYLGLSQQLKQLHIPFSVDLVTQHSPSDYFVNLLSWLGWLILKFIVAFVGAFFVISLLKRIRFFYLRLQKFSLKIVAWLIAFIVLWSGLSYVQYDLSNDDQAAYSTLTHYDQNIQQSEIFQYLQQSNTQPAVQDYLLAQTALLHKPVDKDVATAYVSKLIQAERTDPYFLEYGFKPEQIWIMQHQLYAKSITPIAQAVEPLVVKANRWVQVSQFILIGVAGLSLIVSLILYLIALRLKGRLIRVTQHLDL
ncbi:hypothetical protein [Acinetobacter sp. ANC 4648]|uniref:hypothetical protein n=1 Tax=Acinetobacter sp. ANC 4648 TaxID=1977875 RepID=UPI000A339EFA|nr:hypothetical protein [Acinetobacter sp. ANC 4648]OTG81666.1 hypothetical protein B9T27_10375 [Acinetobacter sp. ANC 4648]